MKYIILLFLTTISVVGITQTKQDTTKQSYNLFHPTPKKQMRGFETDRPDLTESAYTVDAGHFQLETDLFKTDRSKVDGIKTVQNSFNSFNLKLGLANSLDIQFIAETLVSTIVKDELSIKTTSGFENLTIRIKQNIWGNDIGKTALAVLPLINIPLKSPGEITGGLIIPFALSLPNNWGFGSQVETDLEKNQTGKGYHANILASATISHPLFDRFDFFAESLIFRETKQKEFECFIDTGLVYKLNENVKFDTGIYYGLKNTSSRIFFLGMSFRI